MEEYAITYENLVLSTYSIEHILDLHLYEQINDHGMLHLIAIIPEEHAEEYVYTTEPMQSVTLGYRKEDQTTETLYRGLVTDIQINCSGNVYYMDLTVKGKTYAMDIIKRYRSFQNTAMTTHELIREVLSGYQDSDCILQIPNEPIGRLIVQYHETDWEFLVRVVSHYGAVLVPDLVSERLAFYVGIPEQGDEFTITPYHYHVSKSMDEYLAIRENQWADVKEMDFMVFQALDVQIFRVGNFINLYGKRLVIQAVQRELTDGILKNTYTMKRKEGLKGLEIHNYELVGASVIGQVIEISRDKVKVQLEMDEQGRAAYWFPYSTMSASPDGSGWYCMPEKGDKIRLYFPTEKEKDSYAASAYHEGDGGLRVNPECKFWRNREGKEIRLSPEKILLTNNDGTYIELSDTEGIKMVSNNEITIWANNGMFIGSANSSIEFSAPKKITLKQGSTEMKLGGDLNLSGAQIKL